MRLLSKRGGAVDYAVGSGSALSMREEQGEALYSSPVRPERVPPRSESDLSSGVTHGVQGDPATEQHGVSRLHWDLKQVTPVRSGAASNPPAVGYAEREAEAARALRPYNWGRSQHRTSKRRVPARVQAAPSTVGSKR